MWRGEGYQHCVNTLLVELMFTLVLKPDLYEQMAPKKGGANCYISRLWAAFSQNLSTEVTVIDPHAAL